MRLNSSFRWLLPVAALAVASALRADVPTVWLTYGGCKYAFVDGCAPKNFPLTNVWIECTCDKSLPLPGERTRFLLHGLADDKLFNPAVAEISRRHLGALPTSMRQIGCWVRDANGGIPYEMLAGRVLSGGGTRYVFPAGCKPVGRWQGRERMHTTFVRRNDGDWETDFLVASEDGVPDEAYAALFAGRSCSLSFRSRRTYSLFSGEERPCVGLSAVLLDNAPRRIRIRCVARDWDGREVFGWRTEKTVNRGDRLEKDVFIETDEERGIYFLEATLEDVVTGRELAFVRTNVAKLPPHSFATTPETSMMGLAAYWPIPDEESVQKLMDRMGVVRVREGDTRKQHPPRVSNHHCQVPESSQFANEDEMSAWIESELASCRKRGNEYWEFGNELNMSTLGIALEGGGIGKALEASRYAEWIRRVEKIRREKGYEDVKLLSLGVAGFDKAFFEAIYDEGIDGLLMGLCLHPGRGNFTPDYPYVRPEAAAGGRVKTDDPTAHADRLENSNFWNFYGAVRGLKALSNERGKKSLWLTEVYTPTYPNSGWEDTLRDSADNVILTYALSAAEDMKCVFYYQLFDGVWFDRCGINPSDREYFFGLLNRDLSPKPAFMAYCAISEILEGAAFEKWAELPNKNQHGLFFKGGKMGRFVILWDRSEGYVLTKNERPFKSPEPWQKKWKKHSKVTLMTQNPLVAIDSIGRRRMLHPKDELVDVALDGSPLVLLCGENFNLASE